MVHPCLASEDFHAPQPYKLEGMAEQKSDEKQEMEIFKQT